VTMIFNFFVLFSSGSQWKRGDVDYDVAAEWIPARKPPAFKVAFGEAGV
jgi:hypothetical protein